MSKGLLAGDNIAMGMEQAFAGMRAESESKRELERARKQAAAHDEILNANAGNLAEKHALRAALRAVCPNHPLLTNISLQERIKDAGQKAFAITNRWDAAREAGETFNI